MNTPFWKLKRELKRLCSQVCQLPWFIFGPAIRRLYDIGNSKYVSVTEGKYPLKPDVAVLLLFQPNGVEPSVLHTLEHLAERGFSPVVVSNLKLKDSDLEDIRKRSYLVIQRPNYGYDFGGYREAILHLLERSIVPNNLLVMNDSIWFPVEDNCGFLDDVRAQDSDLYGLSINDLKVPSRTHIQSFMFNFKAGVIRSPEFARYWKTLFMANNKNAVIRQCEIKMTGYFARRGFSIGSRYRVNDIYAALETFTNDRLRQIVHYQCKVDTKRSKILSDALDAGVGCDLSYLINERELGKYFLIAHPLVLLESLRCPALKKDRQHMYRVQRRAIFESNLDERLSEIVRKEIAERDQGPPLNDGDVTHGARVGIRTCAT